MNTIHFSKKTVIAIAFLICLFTTHLRAQSCTRPGGFSIPVQAEGYSPGFGCLDKCHFPAFTYPGPVIPYYLVETIHTDYGGSTNDSGMNEVGSCGDTCDIITNGPYGDNYGETYSATEVIQYFPPDCGFTNSFSGSDTYNESHYNNAVYDSWNTIGECGFSRSIDYDATNTFGYTYTLSNQGWIGSQNYFSSTYYFQWLGCGWDDTNYLDVSSTTDGITNSPNVIEMDSSPNVISGTTEITTNEPGYIYSWETGTTTFTLSDLYTDEMLWTNTYNMLMPASYSFTPGVQPGISEITDDHTEGCLQPSVYRFDIPPPTLPSTTYLVTWDVVYLAFDNYGLYPAVYHTASMSEQIQGTGDPVNPAYGTNIYNLTPYWYFTPEDGGVAYEWIANVKATILDGGTPGNGPGPNALANAGSVPGSTSSGGCSSCSALGGGNWTAGLDDGISAQFSLGKSSLGQGVGELKIWANTPSANLATPAALTFIGITNDVAQIWNGNEIRQVYTPQVLVNIATNNAFEYTISYFNASQVTGQSGGLYQVSGSPYVSWQVQNPNGTNSYNDLVLTESRGSNNWVYSYGYNSTNNSWTYVSPGALQQVQLVSSNYTDGYGNYFRTLSGTLCGNSNSIVGAFTKTYQSFPWGEGLISETDGTGAAAKTTTLAYTGGQSTLYGSLQPISQINNPDGSVQQFNYTTLADGSYGISSESDAGSGDVAGYYYSYDYTPQGADDGTQQPDTARTIVKYYNGNGEEVGRKYLILLPGEREDITCVTPGASWSDSGNLVTVTKYYTNGPNLFRIKSVANPDGTMSFYNYAQSTNSWQTNTVSTGQPNSGQTAIINGIQTITILDQFGQTVSVTTQDIVSSLTLQQDIYGNFDPLDRPQQVTHLDGTTNFYDYSCCYLESEVDPDGVLTYYLYDDAKRNVGYEKYYNNTNPITYGNVLDAAGHNLQSFRVGTDDSLITTSQSAYDTAGRLIAQTNALGGVTTYFETNDPYFYALIDTTINPDGGVVTNAYYSDGTLKSTTGTGVHGVRYVYNAGTDANGDNCTYVEEIKLNADGSDSSENTTTFTDMAGRTTEVQYADGSYSQSFYNSQGQLAKQVDPDGVTTLYQYNAKGELAYTAVDMNQNGTIDFSGSDRITQTTNDVITDHGTTVNRTRTYQWLDGQSTGTLTSCSENSADALNAWQTRYRDTSTAVTNHSQTVTGVTRTETATAPDGSYTINEYFYGRLIYSTRYDSTGAQISGTTYGYDAQGRQNTTMDARNGTTTSLFNNADLVVTNTTPNPGGGSPEVTVTSYDNMLRPYSVLQPDGTSVNSEYLLTGELDLQYGSRTYPVGYSYDYAGRMLTMTNWSNFSGNSGARVTTWNYDAERGWLDSKTYDSGTAGPSYTYTPAGRLASRTWARGITTTYTYGTGGDLTNVVYSDGVTPGVTNTYDRLGRESSVAWNGITDTMSYNLANQSLGESFSGGSLAGLAITNGYDADLRRTFLAVLSGSSQLLSDAYGYDHASRLSSVTDAGNNSANYTYLANSPLVGEIVFKQNSTTRMTTTKQYDYLNRLTQISSAPSASYVLPLTFNYNYNPANQRTQDTLADSSYWVYGYDSLGQVTNACKFFSSGRPVPGQQFDYTFDTIGNRTQTMAGGDTNGANLRVANYYANNLNQLTNRDIPPYVDIIGASILTNTVTVNGQVAYRNQEYFRQQLPANNANSALWTNITVSGGQSATGNIYVPQEPEVFQYDADGNLTNDGRWAYTWDGENRLVQMMVNTNVGPQYQLTFAYDAQGRRIQKIVETNGIGMYTKNFLYDGWNLIAVLAPNSSLLNSFMWGNDLSGSQQGAGGVGGLLETTYYGSTTTNCFVAYDGNGNAMGLVNAANGAFAANYEYGAFGEPIRITGPMGRANPFRFSSKYDDDESDLLYYGYRYYKPSTGDWINRDPLMESGSRVLRSRRTPKLTTDMPPDLEKSMNGYAFLRNSSLDDIDALGLCSGSCGPDITRPLEKTLLYVGRDFWLQSENAQIQAGDRMYGLLTGRDDWDISAIHKAARDATYNFEGYVTCGLGRGVSPCDRTLTFEGSCFSATAINYALWGKMNELEQESQDLYGWSSDNFFAHFSLNYAITAAELWRLHYGIDPVVNDQVIAFVRWGYTGTFVLPIMSPCSGSPCAVKAPRFGYFWGGIHNNTMRGN